MLIDFEARGTPQEVGPDDVNAATLPTDPIPLDELHVRSSVEARLFGGDSSSQFRIGRYSVLRKLGEGGMGVVFSAYDEELDRRVAIKLLRHASETAASRMRREAQAMAQISHPNVASVYEVGRWEGHIFLAMEFVRGVTLREWLAGAKHPLAEIIEVMVQAGRGLQAAHDAGLVHRDFKPDNVMVGDDGRVRVLDFGLARGLGEDAVEGLDPPVDSGSEELTKLTRSGTILGTPAYMSPEQFDGKTADARSDQFSFCVAFWEALHGHRPYKGSSLVELWEATRSETLEEPPEARVDASISSILRTGLRADPARRARSVAHLLDAISSAREIQPKRRRRRLFAITLAVVALLAAATYPFWLAQQRGRELEARSSSVARKNGLIVATAKRLEENPARALAILREFQSPSPATDRFWRATTPDFDYAMCSLTAALRAPSRVVDVRFVPNREALMVLSDGGRLDEWSGHGFRLSRRLTTADSLADRFVNYTGQGALATEAASGQGLHRWDSLDDGGPTLFRTEARPSFHSMSVDGSRLATATDDGHVLVWEASDTSPILSDETGKDIVRAIRFSADGAGSWRLQPAGSHTFGIWTIRPRGLPSMLGQLAERRSLSPTRRTSLPDSTSLARWSSTH